MSNVELQLIRLPSGRYTWNRVTTHEPPTPSDVVRAGTSWANEADAFDNLVDMNEDHDRAPIRFYGTPASIAEGGPHAPHVIPPTPGHPVGPRTWSKRDPEAEL